MPTETFQRPTFKRAITAVRRAVLPISLDRVYELDELGAFEIPAQPAVLARPRPVAERRARLRFALPKFAPPAWRLHRRRFGQLLADGAPFSLLEPELRDELAALASWVAVPAGGTLFTEGTPLEAIYVVAQGRFQLARSLDGFTAPLGVAQPGDALGVCSALGHYGALATARSQLGASALRIPLACLVDAACSSPAFYAALARLGEIRGLSHLLAGSAFAEFFGAEGRAGVASLFRRVSLAPRQPLVLPGQVDSFFAVVEQGQLALSTFGHGPSFGGSPERVERTASRGQALGLVAGLQGRPALGAVRALEPTVISLLDAAGLSRLRLMNPSLQGLPAVLSARGELGRGGFVLWEGVRQPAQISWRQRAEQLQLRRVA